MHMNKLREILKLNYSNDYVKTIYSCSCKNKQDKACKLCNSDTTCLLGKDEQGFVLCDFLVYDFDEISTTVNNGTNCQSVDALIVNNDEKASLLEFTDGNPRNKKTHKKCIDTLKTLKLIYDDIDGSKFDYYFVYNTNKLDTKDFDEHAEKYDIIDDNLFLGLMDLNADKEILIKYFTLTKVKELFCNVFPMNQNQLLKVINSDKCNWDVMTLK